MKTRIHIWHHNDNDGRLGAYICAEAEKGAIGYDVESVIFHEMDYKSDPSFDEVGPCDICVIVDYSFRIELIRELCNIAAKVVWIDHHETAIRTDDKINAVTPAAVQGIRSREHSACRLAWDHYHAGFICPYVVMLVDDYDTWKHEIGDTKAFNAGSYLHDTRPGSDRAFWGQMMDDMAMVQQVCNQGSVILEYNAQVNRSRAKRYAWAGMIYDTPCICLDGNKTSSVFDSLNVDDFFHIEQIFANRRMQVPTAADVVNPREFENWWKETRIIMLTYIHDGNEYDCSIYSEHPEVDCSRIAESYGGGGHRGAAGFRCKEIPAVFVGKIYGE